MEPMTLGSPVHTPLSIPVSPSSLGIECSVSTNVFYPSYLMGESHVSANLRVPSGGLSPTRSIRPFSSGAPAPSPASPSQSFKETFLTGGRCTNERQGGPPTMGLLGNSPIICHSTRRGSLRESGLPPGSSLCTSPMTPGYSNSSHILSKDGLLMTPYECDKENVKESSQWVTVFGFPLSSASLILSHFSQLGIVTDHRLPNNGNWMHIKFQNPLQAKKALSKNGKVLNGTFMVGVVQCDEQSIFNDGKDSVFSPHPKDDPQIRSLTNTFHSPRQEKGVVTTVKPPQKSEGIVSKALQHILGI